jgi:hypothetical protein
MVFKYFYISYAKKNIDHFTEVFNITQFSQTDLVISCNIAKQYFFSPFIPIYNKADTENVFKATIIGISDHFEEMINTTNSNINYLGNNYFDSFMKNLNGDISVSVPNIEPKSKLGTMNNVNFYANKNRVSK